MRLSGLGSYLLVSNFQKVNIASEESEALYNAASLDVDLFACPDEIRGVCKFFCLHN